MTYQRPAWPYVSGLTGTWAQDELATADYWCRHLDAPIRDAPIRWSDALACAQTAAPGIYLEVGADRGLATQVRATLGDAAPCALSGLRADDALWPALLTTLGHLYVRGVPLQWSRLWGTARQRVTLPTYPFERQRYWFTPTAPAASAAPAAAPRDAARHARASAAGAAAGSGRARDHLRDGPGSRGLPGRSSPGRRGRVSGHRLSGVGLGGRAGGQFRQSAGRAGPEDPPAPDAGPGSSRAGCRWCSRPTGPA